MPDVGEQPGHERARELTQALEAADFREATALVDEMRSAGETDAALDGLSAFAPTNRRALELLIEVLDGSGTVRRFAGRMLLNQTAIDDVAQDSLISIVESIGSFQRGAKFTSWVYPIVKRRVADYLRRQREAVPLDDELLPGERMSSIIAARTTVQQALAQLPDLYREPVVLRDIEGLSYAEVADRLGRTVGTVKSQISRGRALVAGSLRGASDGSVR